MNTKSKQCTLCPTHSKLRVASVAKLLRKALLQGINLLLLHTEKWGFVRGKRTDAEWTEAQDFTFYSSSSCLSYTRTKDELLMRFSKCMITNVGSGVLTIMLSIKVRFLFQLGTVTA